MRTTATVLMLLAAFLLGAMLSTTVSAASYGPAGLGANLHRRHVMKQAVSRSNRGQPVRRSAILWMAGPRTSAWRGR